VKKQEDDMLVTQEEAWGKVCMIATKIRGEFNPCDAKNCMAWRWSTAPGPPWKGYCGLAGKPENEDEA
jgi:hypothetical protein